LEEGYGKDITMQIRGLGRTYPPEYWECLFSLAVVAKCIERPLKLDVYRCCSQLESEKPQ
jgi:hypothetical protein